MYLLSTAKLCWINGLLNLLYIPVFGEDCSTCWAYTRGYRCSCLCSAATDRYWSFRSTNYCYALLRLSAYWWGTGVPLEFYKLCATGYLNSAVTELEILDLSKQLQWRIIITGSCYVFFRFAPGNRPAYFYLFLHFRLQILYYKLCAKTV